MTAGVNTRVKPRCGNPDGFSDRLWREKYGKTKVFWSADLEKDVQSVFELDPDRDRYLCVRLADAYGLFRYMQHQVLRNRSPIVTKG